MLETLILLNQLSGVLTFLRNLRQSLRESGVGSRESGVGSRGKTENNTLLRVLAIKIIFVKIM